MKSYKSKKAAQRAIDEDEQFYLEETFCPLIQKNCNPACLCVSRPKIRKNELKNSTVWVVEGYVRCSNYMFKGVK